MRTQAAPDGTTSANLTEEQQGQPDDLRNSLKFPLCMIKEEGA